jgi:glutaredoxin
MLCLPKIVFLVLLSLSSFSLSAEVYKWTDESGRTHFSDQPPLNQLSESIDLGEISTYTSAKIIENDVQANENNNTVTEKKYSAKKYSGRKKVVMYSAAWCGICTKAKKYFRKNKIAYKEYDIDTSKKGRRDFKKLKASGVPVILVGKKRLNGFDIKKFESLYRS